MWSLNVFKQVDGEVHHFCISLELKFWQIFNSDIKKLFMFLTFFLLFFVPMNCLET